MDGNRKKKSKIPTRNSSSKSGKNRQQKQIVQEVVTTIKTTTLKTSSEISSTDEINKNAEVIVVQEQICVEKTPSTRIPRLKSYSVDSGFSSTFESSISIDHEDDPSISVWEANENAIPSESLEIISNPIQISDVVIVDEIFSDDGPKEEQLVQLPEDSYEIIVTDQEESGTGAHGLLVVSDNSKETHVKRKLSISEDDSSDNDSGFEKGKNVQSKILVYVNEEKIEFDEVIESNAIEPSNDVEEVNVRYGLENIEEHANEPTDESKFVKCDDKEIQIIEDFNEKMERDEIVVNVVVTDIENVGLKANDPELIEFAKQEDVSEIENDEAETDKKIVTDINWEKCDDSNGNNSHSPILITSAEKFQDLTVLDSGELILKSSEILSEINNQEVMTINGHNSTVSEQKNEEIKIEPEISFKENSFESNNLEFVAENGEVSTASGPDLSVFETAIDSGLNSEETFSETIYNDEDSIVVKSEDELESKINEEENLSKLDSHETLEHLQEMRENENEFEDRNGNYQIEQSFPSDNQPIIEKESYENSGIKNGSEESEDELSSSSAETQIEVISSQAVRSPASVTVAVPSLTSIAKPIDLHADIAYQKLAANDSAEISIISESHPAPLNLFEEVKQPTPVVSKTEKILATSNILKACLGHRPTVVDISHRSSTTSGAKNRQYIDSRHVTNQNGDLLMATPEDVEDVSTLEKMLEAAGHYEQRRRIRAQMRLLKKNQDGGQSQGLTNDSSWQRVDDLVSSSLMSAHYGLANCQPTADVKVADAPAVNMGESIIVNGINLLSIQDELVLHDMLDKAENYESRKKIRARLKEVFAEQRAKRDEMARRREEERQEALRIRMKESEEHKRRTLKMFDAVAKSTPSGSKVIDVNPFRGKESTSGSSLTEQTQKIDYEEKTIRQHHIDGNGHNEIVISTYKTDKLGSTSSAKFFEFDTAKLEDDKKPLSPREKFQRMDSLNNSTNGNKVVSGYSFSKTTTNVVRSPTAIKEMLLNWVKNKTKGYQNIKIENFSTTWNDGMAFCALIHHFYPDAFDYNTLDPKNRRYNFDLAFRVAEEKGDVAPLLEVDDMVTMIKPDWKCVFTYVQSIYRRFYNVE